MHFCVGFDWVRSLIEARPGPTPAASVFSHAITYRYGAATNGDLAVLQGYQIKHLMAKLVRGLAVLASDVNVAFAYQCTMVIAEC